MTRKHKKPRYGLCPKKPRYGLCPKCRQGQMKPDGIAIDKDYSKLHPNKVTISYMDGDVTLQNCFKCHKCGYSEQIKEK